MSKVINRKKEEEKTKLYFKVDANETIGSADIIIGGRSETEIKR
jgi:hypothetical protein